jgi:hypothetical protein
MSKHVLPETVSSSIFHGFALLDGSDDAAYFFARADWMRELTAAEVSAAAPKVKDVAR